MNDPTPPPLPQASIPVQNVLSYAGNQVFERAVFRLIGWVSIVTATVLLISLFLDILLLPQTRLPDWWVVVVEGRPQYLRFGGPAGYSIEVFSAGIVPVASKVLALPLLAGGIGCLRRHARTRAWMLLYALPQLVLSLGVIGVDVLLQLPQNQYLPSTVEIQPLIANLSLQVGTYIPRLAWPILIIYLMTRPYVARLYEKQAY